VFLIEDGKLTAPVSTLRFTQSFTDALQHVKGLSKEREVVADPAQELGCAVVPAVHLAKFRFTGRSTA
jgi:predicted Zn-dependent protease